MHRNLRESQMKLEESETSILWSVFYVLVKIRIGINWDSLRGKEGEVCA